LPTKTNKLSRKLEVCDRCDICGRDAEDAYHAVVRCTKANGLRYALRKHWKLPHEHTFRKTGKDWLLILLNQVDMDTGARILLMFWRAWHLRNNIVHDNGKETIERSISFLLSYATAHENLDVCADDKGKTPMWSSKENGDGAPLGAALGVGLPCPKARTSSTRMPPSSPLIKLAALGLLQEIPMVWFCSRHAPLFGTAVTWLMLKLRRH
jgi:hypothetical protein